MSEFDARARTWDADRMHIERSEAIAAEIIKLLPPDRKMQALEFGAGTGILSFQLRDKFSEIVLIDSSREMIRVCEEKTSHFDTSHIYPLWMDLENTEYYNKFDIIYTQMVMHHVKDTDLMLNKFHELLKPGGILAIADLYTEDGSFHGPEVEVHKGFDPSALTAQMEKIGYIGCDHKTCFVIKREGGREYPVFLLTGLIV